MTPVIICAAFLQSVSVRLWWESGGSLHSPAVPGRSSQGFKGPILQNNGCLALTLDRLFPLQCPYGSSPLSTCRHAPCNPLQGDSPVPQCWGCLYEQVSSACRGAPKSGHSTWDCFPTGLDSWSSRSSRGPTLLDDSPSNVYRHQWSRSADHILNMTSVPSQNDLDVYRIDRCKF